MFKIQINFLIELFKTNGNHEDNLIEINAAVCKEKINLLYLINHS